MFTTASTEELVKMSDNILREFEQRENWTALDIAECKLAITQCRLINKEIVNNTRIKKLIQGN